MFEIFTNPSLQSIANSIIASILVNFGSTKLTAKFKPSFEKAYKKALKDVCKELKPEVAKTLKTVLSKQDFKSKFYEFQYEGKPIDITLFEDPFKSVLGKGNNVRSFFNQFRIHIAEEPTLSNHLQLLFSEQIINCLNFLLKEIKEHSKKSTKAHNKTHIKLEELKKIIDRENKQQRNIAFTIGYTEAPRLPDDFVRPNKSITHLETKLKTNKPVLIYGPPGTGKSLIAAKIVNEHEEKSRPCFWFRFEESLTDFDSLQNNLLAFLQDELKTEDRNILNLLLGSKALIVFDDLQKNMDEKSAKLINAIVNLISNNCENCSLILTSRKNYNLPISKYESYEVQGLAPGEAETLVAKNWGLNFDNQLLSEIIHKLNYNPQYLRFFSVWYVNEKPTNEILFNYLKHTPKKDSQIQLYLIQELFNALGGMESNTNKLLMASAFPRIPETEDFMNKLYKELKGEQFTIVLSELKDQRGLIQFSHRENRYYLHDLLADFYNNLIEDREDLHKYCAELYSKRSEENKSWINNIEASHHFLKAGLVNKSVEILESILFSSITYGYFWDQIYELLYALNFANNLDKENKFIVFSNFAYLLDNKGKWDEAVEAYEKLIEIEELIDGMVYNNLGLVYQKKGKWDKAIELYNKSLNWLENNGDYYGMSFPFNNLGLIYKEQNKWNEAIVFFNKALKIFEKYDNIYGITQVYNNLGLVYQKEKKWNKCIEFFNKSIAGKEKIGDINGLAQTYNNLGLIYKNQGELEKAITLFNQSLVYNEKVGNIQGLAQVNNNLGSVYKTENKLNEAFKFCYKALAGFEKLVDPLGKAQAKSNLGHLFKTNSEWEKATKFYKESLEEYKRIEDVSGIAFTYYNLASVYKARREWNTAIEYYNKSLESKEKVNDIYGMAQIYGNLALIQFEKKEYQISFITFLEILFLFVKINAKEEIKKTLQIIFSYNKKISEDTFTKCYNSARKNILENGIT